MHKRILALASACVMLLVLIAIVPAGSTATMEISAGQGAVNRRFGNERGLVVG